MILAAGSSSRLGKPKQLLQFKGGSLLKHTVEAAVNADAAYVVIVLGSHAGELKTEIENKKGTVIENKDWEEGMASSIRCGLNELLKQDPEMDAVILMVCDQPYISSSVLNELIIKGQQTLKPIVTCNYGETIGPPALFGRQFFSELLKLSGDTGARKIIMSNMEQTASVLFPEGSIDIDTLADYNRLSG